MKFFNIYIFLLFIFLTYLYDSLKHFSHFRERKVLMNHINMYTSREPTHCKIFFFSLWT